jgi:hypothetical protein
MGYSLANTVPESDVAPYLQLENIDPKWLKAVGATKAATEVEDERNHKEKTVTSGEMRSA